MHALHSEILSTFIKLHVPFVVKTLFCLFLNGCFRQGLLYFGCEKTVQDLILETTRAQWLVYHGRGTFSLRYSAGYTENIPIGG